MSAIRDFLNAYAGHETIEDRLTEEAVEKMFALYRQTFINVSKLLDDARKGINYASWAKQTQLLKHIGDELDLMNGGMSNYLHEALLKVADASTTAVIEGMHLYSETTKPEDFHRKYNRDYVELMHKDAMGHIAAQTDKMMAEMKDTLRSEASQVFRLAAVEGISRKEAHMKLKGKLLEKDPSFQFVDKAGRAWKTDTYLEMLTRTVMKNAMRECFLNTMVNEGKDLVKISRHGATDACSRWEGKVVSITGATAGYPTFADLPRSQIFHPRCRHRLLPYHMDIEEIFKAVDEGNDVDQILKDRENPG